MIGNGCQGVLFPSVTKKPPVKGASLRNGCFYCALSVLYRSYLPLCNLKDFVHISSCGGSQA